MSKISNKERNERRKVNLINKVNNSKDVIYLTFTELYRIKQEGLVELLGQGKKVFLIGRDTPPIRLRLATVD